MVLEVSEEVERNNILEQFKGLLSSAGFSVLDLKWEEAD